MELLLPSSDGQYYIISEMGAKAYKILQNLITPATPSDKSFKELVDVMKKHFHLQRSCYDLNSILE